MIDIAFISCGSMCCLESTFHFIDSRKCVYRSILFIFKSISNSPNVIYVREESRLIHTHAHPHSHTNIRWIEIYFRDHFFHLSILIFIARQGFFFASSLAFPFACCFIYICLISNSFFYVFISSLFVCLTRTILILMNF